MASTGPSSGDDGEDGRLGGRAREDPPRASTGPSSGDDGEVGWWADACRSDEWQLQRGRRLETTESAHARSLGVKGYGEMLQRGRRLETTESSRVMFASLVLLITLQRGRRLETTESRRARTRAPRSARSCFNGAVVWRRRRADRRRTLRVKAKDRFNGAVVWRRRREIVTGISSAAAVRCFNGAVVWRRRRGQEVAVVTRTMPELQRGRRLETTERAPDHGLPANPPALAASTGPSSGDDGESGSSSSMSSGVRRRLQRGRRLETTESRRASRAGTPPPRRGFNGAVVWRRRREPPGRGLGGVDREGASTGPSSGDDGERRRGGAARARPLRLASTGPSSGDDGECQARFEAVSATCARLQRGRRLETTDRLGRDESAAFSTLHASTGPSSGDDGEALAPYRRPAHSGASTGPSSGDDGEARWRRSGAAAPAASFNGAVVWRRRRARCSLTTCAPSCLTLQRGRRLETTERRMARSSVSSAWTSLQRGRRLETTERAHGPCTLGTAASCFNGAVVWRRRRAPGAAAGAWPDPRDGASTGPSSGDDGETTGGQTVAE